MERLTMDETIEHCKRKVQKIEAMFRKEHLESDNCGVAEIIQKEYWEHRQVAEWLEQLKSYKDAEEQGLLLRLPFGIGQKVYYIYQSCIDGSFMIGGMVYSYSCLDFPRVYYATREEAEKALEDMKG